MDIHQALIAKHPPKRGGVERIYTRKQIEQAFLETFELIGGIPRLALWANKEENYETFLKLLMTLKPKEAAGLSAQVLEYRSNIPHSPLNGRQAEPVEGELLDPEE